MSDGFRQVSFVVVDGVEGKHYDDIVLGTGVAGDGSSISYIAPGERQMPESVVRVDVDCISACYRMGAIPAAS